MKLSRVTSSFLTTIRSDNGGQSTVEYLIVGIALMVVFIALGVLLGRIESGLFVKHAIDSASHAFGKNTMGSLGDVLLY